MTTPPPPDPGAASARDKAKLALLVAAISPVLSAFLLLSLVLLRLALGPLPRPAAGLVLLPQLAAALLAAHAAALQGHLQPLRAALLAAVMAATFGLHIARQAAAWACMEHP